MRPTTIRRSVALLTTLAAVTASQAAGLDCKRAASAAEKAVCADASLRAMDAALAAAYAQALRDAGPAPRQQAALRRSQRDWLQERDGCGAEAACLATQYRRRTAALGKPDTSDMAALAVLRQTVEAARRTDAQRPLEKAIERFKITSGATSFANDDSDQDGNKRFPRKRPEGVSAAEWKALEASPIATEDNAEADGVVDRMDYTLLDLDGDGLRDLIVEDHTGGTGMVSSISVLRQTGGRFVVPPGTNAEDGAYLYSLSGRPSNNAAEWIRLNGRVYAAYLDTRYGEDQVSLLRPWARQGQVPRLSVRYRYRLAVPVVQRKPDMPATRLDNALHAGLSRAVALVPPALVEEAKPRTTPICPLPADASNEDREKALSYGPGHYTFEVVDDVPVQVGKQCWIGQLRSWFGGYGPDGLAAELCIRKPQADLVNEEACYTVNGPRTVIGIDAGTDAWVMR
jgi:uncharacterized protein